MTDSLAEKRAKLHWMCRRGMLELDIWLNTYREKAYPQACDEEKDSFLALLSEEDSDIFAWLMYNQPVKPALADIVKKVQAINNIQEILA